MPVSALRQALAASAGRCGGSWRRLCVAAAARRCCASPLPAALFLANSLGEHLACCHARHRRCTCAAPHTFSCRCATHGCYPLPLCFASNSTCYARLIVTNSCCAVRHLRRGRGMHEGHGAEGIVAGRDERGDTHGAAHSASPRTWARRPGTMYSPSRLMELPLRFVTQHSATRALFCAPYNETRQRAPPA